MSHVPYTSERRLISNLSEYGLRVIPWVFIYFDVCDVLDIMSEAHIFDFFMVGSSTLHSLISDTVNPTLLAQAMGGSGLKISQNNI